MKGGNDIGSRGGVKEVSIINSADTLYGDMSDTGSGGGDTVSIGSVSRAAEGYYVTKITADISKVIAMDISMLIPALHNESGDVLSNSSSSSSTQMHIPQI